jgi:sulfite exporter TauE/SafE
MDWLSLLGAAFVLGLTGGVHCLAMCAGLQQSALQVAPRRKIPLIPQAADRLGSSLDHETCTARHCQTVHGATLWRLIGFHAARVGGYALLGAAVAGASGALRWAAQWEGPLNTLWILLNAAVLSLGLILAIRGAMPIWIDRWNHHAWARIQAWTGRRTRAGAGWWGLLWVFLPCGLLASAAALAVLASDAARGAAVMASFGLGTAIDLILVQGLWLGLRHQTHRASPSWQTLGVRISGLMLSAFAALALWSIARGQPHPFCAS